MSETRRKFDRIDKALATTAGLAALVGAGLYVNHQQYRDVPRFPVECTIVKNLPEAIPPENINDDTIQRLLRITPSRLGMVVKYAATCHTNLSNLEQFRQGLTVDPRQYNAILGTDFTRCATYGVPTTMIPTIGDEASPAVVVCIDLSNRNEIPVQT